MHEFYTKDELEQAKYENIIHYLQSIGYDLKQEGHYYRGVLHDSMVIHEDGRWVWNSKDLKGYSPVELLKQILVTDFGYDDKSAYINAIKRLVGTEGQSKDFPYQSSNGSASKAAVKEHLRTLTLPERNLNYNRAIAYLCKARGLDYGIVKELILQKKLYETKPYHNVCFVSYDQNNNPRHAFIRGTRTNPDKSFKMDVEHSDKRFGFIIRGSPGSTKLFCFESAIDAISHATLYKMNGLDHKDGHRISLHGTSFLALEQILRDNPDTLEIVSCLDNDETGIRRSKKLCEEFSHKGYRTFVQRPEQKDYNEQLLAFIQERHELDFACGMQMG